MLDLKRGDIILIIIIGVAALVALGIIFLRSPDPAAARIVIQVDGKEKYSFPLYEKGRNEYLDVQGVNGITRVHLEEGRVRVEESACPDKICVNTGWTNSLAKPIACLPNRVIVKVVGGTEEGDIDIQ